MVAILTITYRCVILAVAIFTTFRYARLDRASRVICCLVWLGVLTEAVAYYAAYYFKSNYLVYNVAFYAEFLLTTLYYNYSNKQLMKKRWGLLIIIGGLTAGMLNTLLLQPLATTLNTHILVLQAFTVMCLSLYSIQRLLGHEDSGCLHKKVHFLFPCILMFYQWAATASWTLYHTLGAENAEHAAALDIIVITVNVVTYLAYGLIFLVYNRLNIIDHDD